MEKPTLIATDLESILVPEIWISIAEKTGIKELRLTTRDVPDYDRLMKKRLQILTRNNLSLNDIQSVIETIKPFDGAIEFMDWIKTRYPIIIISDTFYEFAHPLIKKLNYPTIFCHSLETNKNHMILNYHLRKSGTKKNTVDSFKNLGFRVIAIGDSYNDTEMLKEADTGILFNASPKTISEFPQFPALDTYKELKKIIKNLS